MLENDYASSLNEVSHSTTLMNTRKLLGFVFLILGLVSLLTIVLMPKNESTAVYFKLVYIIPPFCLIVSYFAFKRKTKHS